MGDTFEGSIEEAKRLEKKLLEYAPYDGEVQVERTLDLEPRDYVDLTYSDLVNQYERAQKIISTTERGIFAAGEGAKAGAPDAAPAAPRPTAETKEVETRLKEMTTETLKSAEEVSKETIHIEKEAPEAAPEKMEIEFEHRPAEPVEKEIEIEEMAKPEIEIEREGSEAPKEAEERKPPEAPARERMETEGAGPTAPAAPEALAPEKKIIVALPPALRESSDEAADKRYNQMEEQVRAAVGEKADEITLKKKMLELTKQLFKEKSVNKRGEIKTQIAVLKNMLTGAGPAARTAARKAKGADETHQKLFETIMTTQQGDLAQTKDNIINSYNRQLATIKKKFYSDMEMTEDASKRKQIFDAFAFSVTSLVEQLPEVLAKYQDFTVKKHAAEMEKVRASLGDGEKAVARAVDERLEYIRGKYGQEFAPVKGIVAHEIDTLIEVAGAQVFKKGEEKPADAEAKKYEMVKDINETDDGTLLYYLHKKDKDFYKMYERNQISKAEAIFKAKELMAREKGLNEAMVRKYFTHTEGS